MTSEKETRLRNIHFLILKLDEFRAFRRSNPERLRDSFMKTGNSKIFEQIKPALERIAFFPETIPKVASLMKSAALLRQLFPLCFFSIILAFLIRIGVFKIINTNLYNIFLYTPIVIMFMFIIIDQIVRRRIAAAEQKQPELHQIEKQQFKTAVQELLSQLNRELRIYKEDKTKYRLRLYFSDYKGVVIEKEYRENVMFVFKKQHSRFRALPTDKQG